MQKWVFKDRKVLCKKMGMHTSPGRRVRSQLWGGLCKSLKAEHRAWGKEWSKKEMRGREVSVIPTGSI